METNNSNLQMESTSIMSEDRGDLEKILAMLILGLGSLLSGMLPAIISERNRQRFPLTTSLLLCFGAGILLATALVHILPEVNRNQRIKVQQHDNPCIWFCYWNAGARANEVKFRRGGHVWRLLYNILYR